MNGDKQTTYDWSKQASSNAFQLDFKFQSTGNWCLTITLLPRNFWPCRNPPLGQSRSNLQNRGSESPKLWDCHSSTWVLVGCCGSICCCHCCIACGTRRSRRDALAVSHRVRLHHFVAVLAARHSPAVALVSYDQFLSTKLSGYHTGT